MWSCDDETAFFDACLSKGCKVADLFVNCNGRFYAFKPKNTAGKVGVPQGRNGLIGAYTENWFRNLLQPIADRLGLYAVTGVVCEDITLSKSSSGDVALCATPDKKQRYQDIRLLFEVKMSVVSNYTYDVNSGIEYCGDHHSHTGNPSLLRSDSILKAIAKALNVRVSGESASQLPIVVIGNSPITEAYAEKVDLLKSYGICQGFWSVNPGAVISQSDICETSGKGFVTIRDTGQLEQLIIDTVSTQRVFFVGMKSYEELGRIIVDAADAGSEEMIAKRFVEQLRSMNEID